MSATHTWQRRLAVGAFVCLGSTAVMLAQVKSTTTEKKGPATKQVTVERGEVVYVAGNEVVIKMEGGEVREFKVPDGAKAMVDGKQVTLADLRPGMKLEKTITTTTTPKTVETVKTGTWTVVNVQAPNFATVRFEDGSVERYAIPKGTTFAIDGQPKTAFDLRPGMKITATRIVLTPAVDVTKTAQVAGTAPKPATPPMEGALLIAAPAPSSAPTRAVAAASEPAPAGRRLPKTGSVVPLIGLLGLLFSGASIGVRVLRRS